MTQVEFEILLMIKNLLLMVVVELGVLCLAALTYLVERK